MLQSSTMSRIMALALLGISTTGCDAIQGIFKAGFVTGIVVVVVIVAGIVALVAKAS